MLYITEIASVIAEVFCIHIYLHGVLRSADREVPLPGILGYFLFGLVDVFASVIIHYSFFNILCSLLGIFLLAFIVHRAHILAAIFSSLSFMAIVALLDVLVMAVLSLFGFQSEELLALTDARILYMIIEHLLLLGAVSSISALFSKDRGIVSKKTVGLLLPCWVVSILLCCILCAEVTYLHRSFTPLYFIVALGLLYTIIASIYLIKKISVQEADAHRNELAEHHYAMEKEYYQQIHEQQEETRALWHDIDKYFLAMQAMINDKESEQAEDTVRRAKEVLDSAGNIVDVNNTVVSVILNQYVKIAKDQDIQIRLDVQVPPTLFVTAADLYILIGNTMDNAIDACMNLPVEQRRIEIKLKVQNDILFYSIINQFDPENSTKQKNRFHGYGLKSVKKCVEKYAGTLSVSKDNQVFSIAAHLNSV